MSDEEENVDPGEGADSSQEEFDEAERILRFDPFAPAKEEEEDTTEEKEGLEGEEKSSSETSGTSESTEGGEKESPEPDSEKEGGEKQSAETERALKQANETIRQLENRLNAIETKASQSENREKEQKSQDPFANVPQYEYNVPDQMRNLIFSDDPGEQKQGLAAYGKAISRIVHANVLQQMDGRFAQMYEQIPQVANQTTERKTRAEEIKKDFFGAYPEFNKEELLPVVQQIAAKTMQEKGVREWTPEIRDAIGNKLRELLGTPSKSTSSNEDKSKGQKEKPKTQRKPSSRPSSGKDQSNDIMDTLF